VSASFTPVPPPLGEGEVSQGKKGKRSAGLKGVEEEEKGGRRVNFPRAVCLSIPLSLYYFAFLNATEKKSRVPKEREK